MLVLFAEALMKRLTMVLLLVSLSAFACADDLAGQAAAAYVAKDWSKAQALYAKLTAEQPTQSLAWYRLGESHRLQRHFPEALAAFEKAKQLGFQPLYTLSRIAAVNAEMGNSDKALAILEQLAEQQAPAALVFDGTADFNRIAANPRFVAAKRKMQIASTPCKFADVNPEMRQFDFWIGEWDVLNPQGIQAGTSRIDLILSDCVILENWTDRFGGQGKSFNKYNTANKTWEQFWVDEQGTTTYYHGKLEGKNMVFHADPSPDGKTGERTMTFFNLGPDKVRQLGQITNDGGKTWTTQFDLTYVRRGA